MKGTLAIFFAAAGLACAQELGGMAVGILDQANAALAAVAQHDQAAALDHIRQGKALAHEILQVTASDQPPILVETSRNVQTTTTYVDVKKPKHGDNVMTANRLKKNTTIAGTQQEVTASLLDVTSASSRLDSAEAAVQSGDWAAANDALREIPESVEHTRTDGDVPLLRAQQNLELARARIVENKYKDAAGPLRAAAQALSEYEQSFPGPHGQNAEYMRQQMLQFADSLPDHYNDAMEHINVMWLPPIQKWEHEGGAKVVQ